LSDYLVTGACGYLGRNFIRILRREKPDAEIIGTGIDDCGGNKPGMDSRSGIDLYLKADLANPEEATGLVAKADPRYIVHLAGVPGASDWPLLIKGNVQTTANILQAASTAGDGTGSSLSSAGNIRTFIVGSAAEYGFVRKEELPLQESRPQRPVTQYGMSMACRTTIALGYATRGADVVVGRLFNPLGPGLSESMAPGSFAKQVLAVKNRKQKTPIRVGDLEARRDFIDIEDACCAFLAIIGRGRKGEAYNVCSGKSVGLGELLDEMQRCEGTHAAIEVDGKLAAMPGVPDIYGDLRKITAHTGWKPKISLEESVRRMLG